MMFGPDHYVPILKTRPAEFKALFHLDPSGRRRLTPFFELMPPGDGDEDEFVEDVAQFVQKSLESVGSGVPFFVDLLWIDQDLRVNGVHFVEYVFDQLRTAGLHAIPVTGPRRRFDYQNSIKQVISTDNNGVCLRMDSDDFQVVSSLQGLVGLLGSTITNTDILIDFSSISQKQSALLSVAAINYVLTLPSVSSWRTLTLAASAFPQQGIATNKVTGFKRTEWEMWGLLYKQRSSLPRLFTFGDYGIDHPSLPPKFDPTKMTVAASIRYTSDTDFLVFKGRGLKKGGSAQYYDLADQIVSHSAYKTKGFSWGDARIQEYANRVPKKGGNPASWRIIGYNHHYAFVTHQLSNLTWP